MNTPPTLGEQLRGLSETDSPERRAFVKHARRQHAAFWEKWHPFRCSDLGDAQGNAFSHVVDLFGRDLNPHGLRGLFIKFMQLGKRPLVIDVASGVTPSMLKVLLHHHPDCVGYVAIDLPVNLGPIRTNFEYAGYGALLEAVPWDFWEPFPLAALQEIKRRRNAEQTVTLTYWGATYLPSREIRAWVKPALVVSDGVYVNMLTAGRFQPEVLRKRFASYLMQLVVTRRASAAEVARALAALKKMSQFGQEFAPLMPLWTASELKLLMRDMGRVNRVQQEFLWGQTCFVEVLP